MKTVHRTLRAATVIACFLSLAGCSSPVVPESPSTFVGTIVEASAELGGGFDFGIRVTNSEDDECGIRFSVADRTQIFDSRGSSTVSAVSDILEVGATVRVGYDGIFDAGCPSSSTAETIERRS